MQQPRRSVYNHKMKIAFYTLGCKANQYDTRAMISVLEQAGHDIVDFAQPADAYIINSCTVTAESDRKARQIIGRARRTNTDALVVVSGCYAQRDAEKVLAIDGVDAVAGSSGRGNIADVLAEAMQMRRTGRQLNAVAGYADSCGYEENAPITHERIRAHIKIQDGCDRHCTYCIIPYARGPIRSRSIQGIAADADAAGQSGCHEVVLTGIRIAAYGQGEGGCLMDAVDAASSAPSVYRVRLGSLDPDALDEDFIRRAADNPKLCRHFHLSLQSGSDGVLHRMARRYTTAQYAAIMEDIRKHMPDASFTTDIMVGFVGETEREFAEGLDFVRRAGFTRIHVFPYSVRQGTAAARMDGHLDKAVKQERAREMGELARRLEAAYAESLVGKVLEIIPEPEDGGEMQGYARNYCRISIPADSGLEGRVVRAEITGTRGGIAVGNVCEMIH